MRLKADIRMAEAKLPRMRRTSYQWFTSCIIKLLADGTMGFRLAPRLHVTIVIGPMFGEAAKRDR